MAQIVKFGEAESGKRPLSRIGKTLFLPKGGQTITIRFVGYQQYIYQVWDNLLKRYINYDTEVSGCTKKLASFVIDRSDGNVKAFICPMRVFQMAGEYSCDHDFEISRMGMGLSTKYTVK